MSKLLDIYPWQTVEEIAKSWKDPEELKSVLESHQKELLEYKQEVVDRLAHVNHQIWALQNLLDTYLSGGS